MEINKEIDYKKMFLEGYEAEAVTSTLFVAEIAAMTTSIMWPTRVGIELLVSTIRAAPTEELSNVVRDLVIEKVVMAQRTES